MHASGLARNLTKKPVQRRRHVSIDMLPDDVLLEIFNFFADEAQVTKREVVEAWQSLVHVCRRWRIVVFGSPRRLNLRLVCTTETPARDTLDVWPSLPLLIWCFYDYPTESVDDIIAVLEHSDRVCQISLVKVPGSHLEKVSAAMQEPFPELTHLTLWSGDKTAPVFPESFLSGSAPSLRYLWLQWIPFPGLPKLLLSTTHLVTLHLLYIPHSGYISPEAMVTALSTLVSLEKLCLDFQSPQSRPDRRSRRSHPLTRSVLPILISLRFKGVSEYLDDLVACIDAPRLEKLDITFFNQIDFDTPQLVQFIRRTQTLEPFEEARVAFNVNAVRVELSSQKPGCGELNVEVLCGVSDWQLSCMEQVCTSSLPPILTLEDLYICEYPYSRPDWKDNVENSLWMEVLHPFTAVKNFYLSKQFASRIVPALQELAGGTTAEVLPALQNIFLEGLQPSGPVQEGIAKFVALRQLSGHRIAVSLWERDSDSDSGVDG